MRPCIGQGYLQIIVSQVEIRIGGDVADEPCRDGAGDGRMDAGFIRRVNSSRRSAFEVDFARVPGTPYSEKNLLDLKNFPLHKLTAMPDPARPRSVVVETPLRQTTILSQTTEFIEGADVEQGVASELARSAAEASHITSLNCEIERYLNPRADALYGLEYAFHLVGDVREKTVLDLGCGSGENVIPLAKRGAHVSGIDLSPDLINVARRRAEKYGVDADLRVASAYETGLPSRSMDVVFCIGVLHHLDIQRAKNEVRRVLKPGGLFIVDEPVRFSRAIKLARKIFPTKIEVSDDEYPLSAAQLALLTDGFQMIASRSFRSIFAAAGLKFAKSFEKIIRRWDNSALQFIPGLARYATIRTMALREPLPPA